MRSLKITECGEVKNVKGGMVVCPMFSTRHPEGGMDFFPCTSDCAWYSTRSVTDSGIQGAFCGDKYMGDV